MSTEPEIREEYDFSGGERGRYASRFAAGSDVVVLAPDVAERFSSTDAVNEALREWLRSRRAVGDDG
jgi:hypothetical protein